jgi:hypothetical protein
VTYVGKTESSLWRRNQVHYTNIEKFLYHFFDLSTFESQEVLNFAFIPLYESHEKKETKETKEQMKKAMWLFYAPIANELVEYIRKIEGAIQIHLWRKMETRKYLVTPVSDWSLRGYVIKNDFESNDRILGFEPENRVIETPPE